MKSIISGFIIGIAAITPGLSGGVIAASFGFYESIINSLCDLKKDFKNNFIYLFPFLIGGIIGVVLFGKITEALMKYSYYEVMYIFTGLVIGTIPYLLKEANSHSFKLSYILSFGFAFLFPFMSGNVFLSAVANAENIYIKLAVIGIVLSIGTVIPGLSSSFLLMKAGLYNLYISSVSSVNILNLIFIGISFVLTTLVIIKFVKIMFEKFHGVSYYAVLGFLAASIVEVFPGIREIRKAAVDFSLLYLSCVLSFLSMSFKKQN